MQLGEALRAGIARLEAAEVGSPRMNAEVLLMHVLGRDRTFLYSHPEHDLATGEVELYDAALKERASGIPAQYITGHQEFWGLDFLVTPAVLIPRPETEHVVETVLELVKDRPDPNDGLRIADVGTGSGCIALALAQELPQAEIHALDFSKDALDVAEINAVRLALRHRVHFRCADLLAGMDSGDLDFVVSNPPYVGEDEADKVQREVRNYEPHVAVFGGAHGLDVYRRLIPQACGALRTGGWMVLEIGFSQQSMVTNLLAGWKHVSFRSDLQGFPRVIVAQK